MRSYHFQREDTEAHSLFNVFYIQINLAYIFFRNDVGDIPGLYNACHILIYSDRKAVAVARLEQLFLHIGYSATGNPFHHRQCTI